MNIGKTFQHFWLQSKNTTFLKQLNIKRHSAGECQRNIKITQFIKRRGRCERFKLKGI